MKRMNGAMYQKKKMALNGNGVNKLILNGEVIQPQRSHNQMKH